MYGENATVFIESHVKSIVKSDIGIIQDLSLFPHFSDEFQIFIVTYWDHHVPYLLTLSPILATAYVALSYILPFYLDQLLLGKLTLHVNFTGECPILLHTIHTLKFLTSKKYISYLLSVLFNVIQENWNNVSIHHY
jgi:hypothetical protein